MSHAATASAFQRPGPAGTRARTREFRRWLVITLLIGAVFGLWPGLDLWLAGLFFDPAAGVGRAGFVHAHQPLVHTVYQVVPWLGRLGLVLGLVAWWLARRDARLAALQGRTGPRRVPPWRGRALGLLALLVFGLWLAVHVVLKDQWGRPRPENVAAFGGPWVFQPWWQPSRECASNCSFVSGHAGTGYVLLGLGLLGPPARRRRWLVAGAVAGVAIGLGRMIQGGHFASDILGAGLVIWGVALALRRWALVRRAARWRRLRAAAAPAATGA